MPCGVKDCAFSSTHEISTFGFCCKHFEEFTHAFTHKEFKKFASKFDWIINLYETGILELKKEIKDGNLQYSNLAEITHKALRQIEKYKNAKPKTRRKTKA